MTGYIAGFSVYTLAMVGVIFIALVVVKKSLAFAPNKDKSNFLKIENCLNLEPRKNLYVVKAGRERFLISSSGDNCQFMTKLKNNSEGGIPEEVSRFQDERALKKSPRRLTPRHKVQNDDFLEEDTSIAKFLRNNDFLRGESSVDSHSQNDVWEEFLEEPQNDTAPKRRISKYFTGEF